VTLRLRDRATDQIALPREEKSHVMKTMDAVVFKGKDRISDTLNSLRRLAAIRDNPIHHGSESNRSAETAESHITRTAAPCT